MFPRIFIRAVLVALATMPSAFADTRTAAVGPSGGDASGRAIEMTALADDGSTIAKSDGAASLGGAVYNPFAEASKSHGPGDAATARSLNADGADLTFTVIAALVGVAAFAYVMRRAWDA
jgi:hypothetical protein